MKLCIHCTEHQPFFLRPAAAACTARITASFCVVSIIIGEQFFLESDMTRCQSRSRHAYRLVPPGVDVGTWPVLCASPTGTFFAGTVFAVADLLRSATFSTAASASFARILASSFRLCLRAFGQLAEGRLCRGFVCIFLCGHIELYLFGFSVSLGP